MDESPYRPPAVEEQVGVRGPHDYDLKGETLVTGPEVDLSEFCFHTGVSATATRLKIAKRPVVVYSHGWLFGVGGFIAAGLAFYFDPQSLIAFVLPPFFLIVFFDSGVRVRVATSKRGRRIVKRRQLTVAVVIAAVIVGLMLQRPANIVLRPVTVPMALFVVFCLAQMNPKCLRSSKSGPMLFKIHNLPADLMNAIRNQRFSDPKPLAEKEQGPTEAQRHPQHVSTDRQAK